MQDDDQADRQRRDVPPGDPHVLRHLPLSLCSVLAIIAIIQSVLFDPETRESLTCDEPVELQKERTV